MILMHIHIWEPALWAELSEHTWTSVSPRVPVTEYGFSGPRPAGSDWFGVWPGRRVFRKCPGHFYYQPRITNSAIRASPTHEHWTSWGSCSRADSGSAVCSRALDFAFLTTPRWLWGCYIQTILGSKAWKDSEKTGREKFWLTILTILVLLEMALRWKQSGTEHRMSK